MGPLEASDSVVKQLCYPVYFHSVCSGRGCEVWEWLLGEPNKRVSHYFHWLSKEQEKEHQERAVTSMAAVKKCWAKYASLLHILFHSEIQSQVEESGPVVTRTMRTVALTKCQALR